MRRVSSRQRLVSWDAFDASAPDSSSEDDDDNMSDYLTAAYDPSPSSRRSSLGAFGTFGGAFGRDEEDEDVDDEGGMFALDLEDDSTVPAAASAAGRAPPQRRQPAKNSVVGKKRDRSAADAGGPGTMKKSVSFSSLLASNVTPANSAPPSAPATPLPPSQSQSFVEAGPRQSLSTALNNIEGGLPAFPTLADPVPIEDEDDVLRPEEEDEDHYGHMPALSTVAAILQRPASARAAAVEEEDSTPLGPEDVDDDDYGKLPVLSAAAASEQQGHPQGSTTLVPSDEDDDDYGKLPAVSSTSALDQEEPLAPQEDDEDGDDYGKSPVLAAAAASSRLIGRIAPLVPREDDLLDGDDCYGRMPALSSAATAPGAAAMTAVAQQPQLPPLQRLPRNESELSLGLRYMTPLPSTADLGSLDSSLHRALQLSGARAPTSLQMLRSPEPALPPPPRLLLTSLADDPLLRVLSYLPPYDVRRASASCRSLRVAVAGTDAGRHLWTGMMAERWPTLGRIADRMGGGGAEGQGGRGFGNVEFVDGAGVTTAGLGADDALARLKREWTRDVARRRDGRGDGGDDEGPNLSVLLGMSALRSPSRVDPHYHVPTAHRTVEFRSYDLVPSRPEEEEEGGADERPGRRRPTAAAAADAEVDDDEEEEARLRRAESRRRARAVLADAGPVPVMQFTGRVGAGDRCVRSDAPLARPSLPSDACDNGGGGGGGGGGEDGRADGRASRGGDGVGAAAGGDVAGGHGHGHGHHGPGLSSSPTARMIEFLRRSGLCGFDRDGRDGPPRPFVTPFVASSSSSAEKTGSAGAAAEDGGAKEKRKKKKATVTVDLTPRLVSYFEVSILPRDEAQEPPVDDARRGSADTSGRPTRETDATARAAREWLRAGTHHPHPPARRWTRAAAAEAGAPVPPAAAMMPAEAAMAMAPPPHPGQHIPTVHFHHPLMPLPLPLPMPAPRVPNPRLLPLPRAGAGAHQPGMAAGGRTAPRRSSSSSSSDCVAVGLSTRSFLAHRRMPGWDRHSYGYHGDDGGIFHSSGEMERIFGPTYGPGDTVGCGVDYLNGGVFFALNGEFLGYAWTDLPGLKVGGGGGGGGGGHSGDGGEPLELYPTVGVDSACPVALNFGEREFAFDLGSFVRGGRHGDAVRRALGGLVRGRDEEEGGGDGDEGDCDGGCGCSDGGEGSDSSERLRRMATV